MKKFKQKLGIVLLVWITITPLMQFALATESLVGSDDDADLYEFDYHYLNDVYNDLDDEIDDYIETDEFDFDVDDSNKMYNRLVKRLESRQPPKETTGRPDKIDILTINFELDTAEIIITVADNDNIDDYDDDELMFGLIWSEEHIYMLKFDSEDEVYYNLNNETDDDVEIDDEEIRFHSDELNFNDEEYVRCILIHWSDKSDLDKATIEFYSNEFNFDIVYRIFVWIMFFVAIGVIVVLVYWIFRYNRNGVD